MKCSGSQIINNNKVTCLTRFTTSKSKNNNKATWFLPHPCRPGNKPCERSASFCAESLQLRPDAADTFSVHVAAFSAVVVSSQARSDAFVSSRKVSALSSALDCRQRDRKPATWVPSLVLRSACYGCRSAVSSFDSTLRRAEFPVDNLKQNLF